MTARRHRKQHSALAADEKLRDGVQPTGGLDKAIHAPQDGTSDTHDESLDVFFDSSRFRLDSLMQRQRGLVTMARHFALSSLFVPVAGIVLGLLAILFAKEARDMFELVGSKAVDRKHARQALIMGTIGTGFWLVATIVLIYVLTARGL